MELKVEIKNAEPQLVMQIRFKAKRSEIGAKLGEILGKVYGHVLANGGEPTMMPFCRYYDVSQEPFDMAAGIAVVKTVVGKGDIKADTLPGGKQASTWHVGPYEKLVDTCAALNDWLREHRYESSGEFWEIYWTDPGAEPDPGLWRTEVVVHLT